MSTEKFSPATTVLSLSSVRPFIGSLFRADDRIEEIKLVQPPLSARQLEISALSQATFDLHQTFCQNLHRLVLADASLRFDPSAAASFTAAILSASRKRQLDALYAAPENFGLPHQLSELVQSFLRFHPVLRTGASYPLWTKNLEGMLGRGEIDQLIQISKVSPLFEAITRNQPEITLVALNELGADHQDEEGNYAVHYVGLTGHHACLTPLLSKNAALSAVNQQGQTALHLAIIHGHMETAAILLDRGIRVDTADRNGHDALALAVIQGRLPLIEQLLSLNPRSLYSRDIRGRHLLHLAAEHNQFPALKFLMEKEGERLPIDALSGEGRNLLHYACQYNQPEMIRYLQGAGVSLREADTHGALPLHYAARLGHVETVKAILSLDDTIPVGLEKELQLSEHPAARQILGLLENTRDRTVQSPLRLAENKSVLLRNLVFEGRSLERGCKLNEWWH